MLSGEACPDREKLMKSGEMGICGAVVLEPLFCRSDHFACGEGGGEV